MEGQKKKNDIGVVVSKLWVTRSLYAADALERYFEILTYRNGDYHEASLGQISELSEKPNDLYSNCFICLGAKPVIPIDSTRCGYNVQEGKIVFLGDVTRGKIARVREDVDGKKKYRFLVLYTVDSPVEGGPSGNDEILAKHFNQFNILRNAPRRGESALPKVGSSGKDRSESSTKRTPIVPHDVADPKPTPKSRSSKSVTPLDQEVKQRDLYKAFLTKCALPMKLETASVPSEASTPDSHFQGVEDFEIFKLLTAYLEKHSNVKLDMETIAALDFVKTRVGPGTLVFTMNKDRMRTALRTTKGCRLLLSDSLDFAIAFPCTE